MIIFLLSLILLIPNISLAGTEFPGGWCTDRKIRNGTGFCHMGRLALNGGDFPVDTSDCVDSDDYETHVEPECGLVPSPATCTFHDFCEVWDDPNKECTTVGIGSNSHQDPNYVAPYTYSTGLAGMTSTVTCEDPSNCNHCDSGNHWTSLDIESEPNTPIALDAETSLSFYTTLVERPTDPDIIAFGAPSGGTIASRSFGTGNGYDGCAKNRGRGSILTGLPANTHFVQIQVHDKEDNRFGDVSNGGSITRHSFFDAAGNLMAIDFEAIEDATRTTGVELHQWISGEPIAYTQWDFVPTDLDGDGSLDGAAWQGAICTGNDIDGDTILDGVDVCPFTSDVAQTDTDMDGIGDACQCGDVNQNGTVSMTDVAKITTWTTTGCGSIDLSTAQGTWPQECQDLVTATFDPLFGNTNNQTVRNLNITDIARLRRYLSQGGPGESPMNLQWCHSATIIQNPAAFNQSN